MNPPPPQNQNQQQQQQLQQQQQQHAPVQGAMLLHMTAAPQPAAGSNSATFTQPFAFALAALPTATPPPSGPVPTSSGLTPSFPVSSATAANANAAVGSGDGLGTSASTSNAAGAHPSPSPSSMESGSVPDAPPPQQHHQQEQQETRLEKQWSALKAMKWYHGKELTAYIQDLALQNGTRALVATSGGSYKKFVCSSETPCPWLINAVCSRPRKRARQREASDEEGDTKKESHSTGKDRYWYVTSGTLKHENCTSTAKPTARQLKNSLLMQSAVQDDSRVSSAVLVERLKAQEKLVCSKSMVYKAKTDLLDEMAKSEQQGGGVFPGGAVASSPMLELTQCLPSYLAQMSALNPHVMSLVERDDDGCFLRAVLAMDPTGVWNDQSVLGVDSSEMQHRSYNGTELVLVGRDGNLNPIVHAIALVPEENPEHCTWFLEKMIGHGFPLRRFPLYTNGHWGFSASCATLQIPHVMYCTQHLISDMKENQSITLRHDGQEALVWKAQQAENESEYLMALSHLGQLNFAAAHYVKSLDPKRWALFPYLTLRKMYGWQTTLLDAVDHGHAMGLAPRKQLPYEFFKAMTLILMNGTFQRHERAVQWERDHRVVTPESERMMQDEMKVMGVYNVVMSTPHLAFVWNTNEPQIRQRRVDLQHRTCTCSFRMQWGIPCRHILAALQKLPNGLNQCYEYFDECYLVRNFISSFKGRYLELPLEESIQRDPSLLPARLVNKATGNTRTLGQDGQPGDPNSATGDVDGKDRPPTKKRRVRTRPIQDRKRGIYKCHKCHRAEGHNKGTCPYQQPQQPQQVHQQALQ